MIRLGGVFGDYCPLLLDPAGDVAAPRHKLLLLPPAGHLAVVPGGGLEPLQRLVEARPALYARAGLLGPARGAVGVCRGEGVGLAVGLVVGRGGVHLPPEGGVGRVLVA